MLQKRAAPSFVLVLTAAVTVIGAISVGIALYLRSSGSGDASLSAEHEAAADVVAFLSQVPLDASTEENEIDRARRFVTNNSIHEIDDEFYSYGNDIALILSKILGHAKTGRDAPHLECSTRTNALMRILEVQGIATRRVYAFSDKRTKLRSHTFLEVKNPETGAWEIHDPDYGIIYVERASGRRVSADRLLTEPLDAFTPCVNPGDCGWEHAEALRDYFGAVGYKDGRRPPHVLVNPVRFDIQKTYEGDAGTYRFADYVRDEWGKNLAEIRMVSNSTGGVDTPSDAASSIATRPATRTE